MKNLFILRRLVICSLNRRPSFARVGFRLGTALILSLAAIGVAPHLVSRAQEWRAPNRVLRVSAQPAGAGTKVSVAADSPLGRAQNWQDGDGFHLVLPNTVAADSLKTIRGIKVTRVGTSLEVLFQTKPGSTVNVQADGNEITLVVDKKLEALAPERDSRSETGSFEEQQRVADSTYAQQSHSDSAPLRFSSPVTDLSSKPQAPSGEIAQTTSNWNPQIGPSSALPAQALPERDAATAPQEGDEVTVQVEDEGALASIFSATSVFIVITLGLFGLLVSRKLRSRHAVTQTSESAPAEDSEDADWVENQTVEGRIRAQHEAQSEALVKSGGTAVANGPSRQSGVRMSVAGPTTLFGAYRIDQEVGKLILGQPHRMDVLASRASDDRRAIETSLTKGVNALDLDESGRSRARAALEEYGFVARQCATLLLAPDAFERTSAARSLGEIKSEAALPFLLEGLYDSESIVRNQAVLSIGELKLPSAIGALLDIARTHPDVPSALLSRTLSACSVEGLDFFDAMPIEPAQLGTGDDLSVIEQITQLEPASSVEELPEHADDEQLNRALSLLGSVDVQERAEALKTLAQFRVRSSVEAITRLARHESEPNLRAIAIFSLGSIDHESVFAAILIGMADESREVRAAAARALNRLSFDRADAYVRVIETSDEETISNVAKACIQAGIVSQNVDRLASSDYRQAYETFSLICLLAKANMNDPILNTIVDHPNMDVRLKAVHLLAATGQPGIFEHLRQLAVRDGVREEVKTALLEAMYNLDQKLKREEKETIEASEADSEPHFETPEPEAADLEDEPGFAFAFEPVSESDQQPNFEVEVQQDSDDLEL
jgi:HEAT repeat protein